MKRNEEIQRLKEMKNYLLSSDFKKELEKKKVKEKPKVLVLKRNGNY